MVRIEDVCKGLLFQVVVQHAANPMLIDVIKVLGTTRLTERGACVVCLLPQTHQPFRRVLYANLLTLQKVAWVLSAEFTQDGLVCAWFSGCRRCHASNSAHRVLCPVNMKRT